MKRSGWLLAAGVLICMSGAPASGQIAWIEVVIPGCPPAGDCGCAGEDVLDTLLVRATNLNMWLSTVEFAVYFGTNDLLMYLQDIHLDGCLHLGRSYADGPGGLIDGVTITYPMPLNAYSPVVVMRILVLSTCDDCSDVHPNEPQVIAAVPHEGTGRIEVVRWPDYQVSELVGLSRLVCGEHLISTEESTWGRIKALYR